MAGLLAVIASGCGGGGDGDRGSGGTPATKPTPKPAASADEFAARFERLSSLELEAAEDTFGTRLDEPADDPLGYRFSGYTFYWTGDDSDRDILLEGKRGSDGTRWERVDDDWSVAKAYGPRLVVSWVGAESRGSTPEWERLDRLAEAAYTGDLEVLEPEERPCSSVGIDPLKGQGRTCSVDGIPVTSVTGTDRLVTPALDAEVTGMSTSEEAGAKGGIVPPQTAEGTFVVVAYQVRNSGERAIRYLRTQLRIGDDVFDQAPAATAILPRSGTMPLAPERSLEAQVAFDVPSDLAERARREGVLVMPADYDELDVPNVSFAQGWVRLATAPDSLPQIAPPEQPAQPPPPPGPPDIALDRGDGPPIGGTARRLYTANTFFPLPRNFVPGGVNVGNTAAECEVPPVDRRVRAGLLATVRRDTPRKNGRVAGLGDRQILLADCGREGRWAIVAWVAKGGAKGQTIFVNEFERRGGAWRGSPKGRAPGCGIPPAAAAAWQIDISHCEGPGDAPGEPS